MSLPGDENPNPQWQLPKEPQWQSQWQSGSPLGEQEEAPAQEQPGWEQPAPGRQQRQPAGPNQGAAVAALIFGIVGFALCPFVGSVLALVLGYLAKRGIQAAGGSAGGVALAAIVVGWLGLAIYVLLAGLILLGAVAS
jgi:hypothetical protein